MTDLPPTPIDDPAPDSDPPDDGAGLDAPLDIEAIVEQAQRMMGLTLPTDDDADEPADDPEPVATTDDPPDADDPPSVDAPASPGSDTSLRPLASESGEEPPDDPPSDPEPVADADPAPELDEWARVGAAWETVHGARPTYDDLERLSSVASQYEAVVTQLNSLPADRQQVVASILDGTFDPVAYARSVAPASADPASDFFDDDPSRDPVVGAINDLRSDFQRQQEQERIRSQQEWQSSIQSDLNRLHTDIRSANPHLDDATWNDLAESVNRAGTWVSDMARTGSAYDAYGRHVLAHAVARGVQINDPAATTPTPTPTPAPVEIPDPPPITAAEQAQAERRQAAAGAVAGSAAPARRRRSPLDSTPEPTATPRTTQDLGAALLAGAEELFKG